MSPFATDRSFRGWCTSEHCRSSEGDTISAIQASGSSAFHIQSQVRCYHVASIHFLTSCIALSYCMRPHSFSSRTAHTSFFQLLLTPMGVSRRPDQCSSCSSPSCGLTLFPAVDAEYQISLAREQGARFITSLGSASLDDILHSSCSTSFWPSRERKLCRIGLQPDGTCILTNIGLAGRKLVPLASRRTCAAN